MSTPGGNVGVFGLIAALLGTGGLTAVMGAVINGMFNKSKQTADTIQVATDTAKDILQTALQEVGDENARLNTEIKELRRENSALWKRITNLEKRL